MGKEFIQDCFARLLISATLFAAGSPSLHAQDSFETPSIGSFSPVQEILSTDESLETEEGPAPGAPGGIPVDGGLSLLLAVGGFYGTKRLLSRKSD